MNPATLPLTDWQFWATSALALGAAWWVLRPFFSRRRAQGPGCPGCGSCEAVSRDKIVRLGSTRPAGR